MKTLPAVHHHPVGWSVPQPGPSDTTAALPCQAEERKHWPSCVPGESHHCQGSLCFAQREKVINTLGALWRWASHQDCVKPDSPWEASMPVLFMDMTRTELHPSLAFISSAAAGAAYPSAGRLTPSTSQWAIFIRQATISISGKQRFWQCSVLFPALPLSLPRPTDRTIVFYPAPSKANTHQMHFQF